jgi:hypothetical protein
MGYFKMYKMLTGLDGATQATQKAMAGRCEFEISLGYIEKPCYTHKKRKENAGGEVAYMVEPLPNLCEV